MKKTNIICVLAILLSLIYKQAYSSNDRRFGAGFILGVPSGLACKYFFDGSNAADLGIGSDLDEGYYIYADYLRHFGNVFPIKEMSLYFGVGLGLHHFRDGYFYKGHQYYDKYEENRLDIRVPVGAEYNISKAPLGVFLELVPVLRVIHDIDFDFWGGIGLRYYFNL